MALSLRVFNHWAGSIPFQKSIKIQEELKLLAKKSQIHFFGFESASPVITMGVRSDQSHILWSDDKLKQNHISKMSIRRGGSATLHSPGQMVIYPVICLPLLGLKVRDFISALESITKEFLEDMGISSYNGKKYAGLYTKRGKLCFFGIHISESVSQHGLSVNVDNDLFLFDSIKSCGLLHRRHDRLSLYDGLSLDKKDLFFKWCDKACSWLKQLKPSTSFQLADSEKHYCGQ